ncbi:AP2-like ethylene-responsive transcription factor [Chloropicon primus]|uniref:AP2-like ethylene-responsive transcription factor n=1 Tax=Chloropicon primus TaxID=1764295 RepID=A0A5B8MXB3_9CHLO|nr:AP2-like ethylene-responsive transcription factor [Chloropicon primus]|eukprot:QDZ25229.1 AP2-like ethylene-responsive transcription factor [Chloropicon primus]
MTPPAAAAAAAAEDVPASPNSEATDESFTTTPTQTPGPHESPGPPLHRSSSSNGGTRRTHTLAEIKASLLLLDQSNRSEAPTNLELLANTTNRAPLPPKKGRRGPSSRSSAYRGVTFYRRTSRWEAHVWTQGRQQYLGGYRDEVEAARAYDKAVLKIRGREADTNFPAEEYAVEMAEMKASEMTTEEFIAAVRSEAKRQNKVRRERTGGRDPYQESQRLKSCRRWLEKTFGQQQQVPKASPPPPVPQPTAAATTTVQQVLQSLLKSQHRPPPSPTSILLDQQLKQIQLVEQVAAMVKTQQRINKLLEELQNPLNKVVPPPPPVVKNNNKASSLSDLLVRLNSLGSNASSQLRF